MERSSRHACSRVELGIANSGGVQGSRPPEGESRKWSVVLLTSTVAAWRLRSVHTVLPLLTIGER